MELMEWSVGCRNCFPATNQPSLHFALISEVTCTIFFKGENSDVTVPDLDRESNDTQHAHARRRSECKETPGKKAPAQHTSVFIRSFQPSFSTQQLPHHHTTNGKTNLNIHTFTTERHITQHESRSRLRSPHHRLLSRGKTVPSRYGNRTPQLARAMRLSWMHACILTRWAFL